MSSTAHLQIYDAVIAALRVSATLGANDRIKTMRTSNRPMADDVPFQVKVWLDHTQPTALIGGNAPVDWSTRIRIECTARDVRGGTSAQYAWEDGQFWTGNTSAFDLATFLAADCQALVLQSESLQALVAEILPGPMQWGTDEADTSLANCQIAFTVVHRTPFSQLHT